MNSNDRLASIVGLGKWRYILLYGVLGWGLSTAALVTFISYFLKEKMSTAGMVRPFFILPLAGIFWGMFMWSFLKKKHDDKLTHAPHSASRSKIV